MSRPETLSDFIKNRSLPSVSRVDADKHLRLAIGVVGFLLGIAVTSAVIGYLIPQPAFSASQLVRGPARNAE